MRLIRHFLRLYSYLFETAVCGAGLLLGVYTAASSNVEVHVPWLPWAGREQIRWVVGLSVVGILSVALAVFGTLRMLLFLFSAVVVGVLMRGLFMNLQYSFGGAEDAFHALLFVLAAFLAFIGAFPGFGGRRRRA